MNTSQTSVDQIRENALIAFEPDQPLSRGEAVFSAIAEVLTECGHFTLPEWAPISIKVGRRTVTAHGYELDEDLDVLTIFHLLDCHRDRDLQQHWERANCPSGAVEKAVAELEALVHVVRESGIPKLDASDRAIDLCRLLERFLRKDESRICICIWTTGDLTKEGWKRSDKSKFHTAVWDATRLCNALDSGHEALSVDFAAVGGIDCLLDDADHEKLTKTGNGVLLGKLPGAYLADLYFQHRTRLLQQNVRAFLNFTGSVNQGIRDTIKTEPERFLSYNNGIAVTASSVTLEPRAPGVYRLLAATDFQIVNGGQTTAALMHTRLDHKSDLMPIQVAMKLTVVRPEDLDDLVPKISLYANSQNKVQEADFASNNPWLVKLEDISRKIEAPKDEKSAGQPVQWYFERVRGQYNVDLGKQPTAATKTAFKAKRPPRTKFGKTDLSTVLMTWECEPQTVSLGRQKCFGKFIKKLSAAKDMAQKGNAVEPSEEDFRRIACLLILRREALAACKELEIAAYRANVVAYAISLIAEKTKTRLPFSDIWATQALPPSLAKCLRIALRGSDKIIREEAAARRQNITEFAKKDDCWKAILNSSIQLDLGTNTGKWDVFSIAHTLGSVEMIEATDIFFRLSEADWVKVANALERRKTNPTYSGVAKTMAKYTTIRKKPTEKQARILARGLIFLRDSRVETFGAEEILNEDWAVLEGLAK